VLEVDLPNRRLQLEVDGTKRDFYLPAEGTAGHKMQGPRLRGALATLKPGFRVALLYRSIERRSVITDLIGGGKVRHEPGWPHARRPRGTRQPPPPPQNPRTAPELPSPETPSLLEGVLAGRFVGREGEEVRVRRADGKVVTCALPPADADGERRARVLAVIDTIKEDGQVYLTYEERDGKLVIKDTGIVEVR
jgi:hypothetical protein